jgi:anti-sigma factor RsiW
MTCDEIDELLSDYVDDELGEETRGRVAAHLASCAGCAAELRKLRRTLRFVRANGAVDPSRRAAGANYADFTRSLVDAEAARSTGEVLLEWLSGDRAKGDAR